MTKMTLLRSAGIGAMLTLGLSVAAHAADAEKADAHHKKHHAVAKAAESQTGAEIAALKAEVAALEQRLDASNAAAQQAQAAAQQAQASAQAAQTAAQNDQQAINQIPTDVNHAVAALPKTKLSALDGIGIFDANTKVGGTVYYDFTNINQDTNGKKVAPSGTGFDLKRAYLSVDHKFNDVWSANITTDVQYSTAGGLNATELYIKKAYVQGKFSPMLTVRLGAADTPWIPYAESVYGYRYVENTISERVKFATSSDWGAHALGSFFGGHVNYAVSVVNGVGYKEPGQPSSAVGNGSVASTQGHTKGMDVEGRVDINYGPFIAAISGYDGQRGNNIAGAGAPVVHHTADRFNALAAYKTDKFRLGVEYFSEDNWASITAVTSDRAWGVAPFGSFNFTPKISVFGRYDFVKLASTTTPERKDNYFNFGVNYEPVKILDFSLVYKRDQLENGAPYATTNGAIGGTNTIGTKGTYDEVGLFGQIKW